MTFPIHDEIRIKRLPTGYLTELCKNGVCHTKLFDSIDGKPTPYMVMGRLMDLCEVTNTTIMDACNLRPKASA